MSNRPMKEGRGVKLKSGEDVYTETEPKGAARKRVKKMPVADCIVRAYTCAKDNTVRYCMCYGKPRDGSKGIVCFCEFTPPLTKKQFEDSKARKSAEKRETLGTWEQFLRWAGRGLEALRTCKELVALSEKFKDVVETRLIKAGGVVEVEVGPQR